MVRDAGLLFYRILKWPSAVQSLLLLSSCWHDLCWPGVLWDLPERMSSWSCMPGTQIYMEVHFEGELGGTDVRDLCRHLSSRLFASKAEFHPIFDFLSSLHSNGQRLMLGESITTYEEMGAALTKAEKLLENMDAEVGVLILLTCAVLTQAGMR